MNTKTTISRRIALATVVAGLALTTVACGSEEGVEPVPASQGVVKTSPVKGQALMSPDAIERAAKLRAERADALRWARGHTPASQSTTSGTATERAASDRAARAEARARAERADAMRAAHGYVS